MSSIQKTKSIKHRLLHWGVAFSVFAIVFVLDEGDWPHRYVGYFASALVLLRLYDLVSNRVVVFKAGWLNRLKNSVHLLIWLTILSLAVSGWMMGLDRFWGEDWLERVHEFFSQALKVLILVHLVGIFRDSVVHKRPTWLLMITGKDTGRITSKIKG